MIENTGPLDTKRMETVDEEFIGAAIDFIDRKHKAEHAVVLLLQPDAHACLDASEAGSPRARPGSGVYPDGMVELDGYVGQLLKKLDDLGIADNTIVVFTTDNGAEVVTWPDGGTRRSAARRRPTGKAAFACRCVIRWPGTIKPGTVYNEMCSHYDLIPTFAAAAAIRTSSAKVLQGLRRSATRPSRSTSTATISCRSSRARRRSRRARSSSTGTTTASCRDPRQRLEIRLPRAAQQGHRRLAGTVHQAAHSRSCSTCAPIRSSAATRASLL